MKIEDFEVGKFYAIQVTEVDTFWIIEVLHIGTSKNEERLIRASDIYSREKFILSKEEIYFEEDFINWVLIAKYDSIEDFEEFLI